MANTKMELTRAGLRLYGKIQRGECKLTITRIIAGTAYLAPGEDATALEAVKSPVDVSIQITSNTIIGDGQTEMYIVFGQSDADYHLRELGVMATDPDEGEILYAYCNFGDMADFISAYSGEYVFTQEGIIFFAIGNAAEVIFDEVSIAQVSREEFLAHAESTENPHNVTAEQVGIINKEILDGITAEFVAAWDRAAEASHIHSNEDVLNSITPALVMAWNAAYAHVLDNNNPHSVTKSQVGLGNVTNESKTTMFTSPTFTGTPKAPTPASSSNNTQIATTAFVTAAIAAAVSAIVIPEDTTQYAHTHANKVILDTITQAFLDNAATAYTHVSNKNNPHSVTKSQVGLGNVTNESKTTMFTSPTFTGTPKAPTPASSSNNTQLATTAFVKLAIDAALSDIIDYINISVVVSFTSGSPGAWAITSSSGAWHNSGSSHIEVDYDSAADEFDDTMFLYGYVSNGIAHIGLSVTGNTYDNYVTMRAGGTYTLKLYKSII